MNQPMDAHACRSQSPSGSYRASIGFTPIGETCFHCDVKITKDLVLPKAIKTTELPSKAAAGKEWLKCLK